MNSVSVEVAGISVCAPYQGYVVILKEQNSQRWLPIFIGHPEAQTISLLLQEIDFPRPLTYDMFNNLLQAAGATVEKITVVDLRDNTFFAEITLNVSGETRRVDARPSDAIALALKTQAPIFVNEEVLNEVGMEGEIGSAPPSETSDKLEELTKRLEAAVAEEAYEEAAKIRDQIKGLERKSRSS